MLAVIPFCEIHAFTREGVSASVADVECFTRLNSILTLVGCLKMILLRIRTTAHAVRQSINPLNKVLLLFTIDIKSFVLSLKWHNSDLLWTHTQYSLNPSL